MLKIPKGLKKKKKGKKSKRKGEEELFTEEELEKYRKEHQQQAEGSEGQSKENEEWSKFKNLTAGVDSILQKTQGDLDRIKSTSFFQRVPAGPKQVDSLGREVIKPERPAAPLKREIPTVSEADFRKEPETEEEDKSEYGVTDDESEEEDQDDIFDTSYVEAVERGEVKLAYVPDSPDEFKDDTLFDTSYVDTIIKGQESKVSKGKKALNIGVAVEVLTGRIDNVTVTSKRSKRVIPGDLLFDSVEDAIVVPVKVTEEPTEKSILDADTEIPITTPIDLSVSLHTHLIKQREPNFDGNVFNTDEVNIGIVNGNEEEDDEFSRLAAESLETTTVINKIDKVVVEPVLQESWSAFEANTSENVFAQSIVEDQVDVDPFVDESSDPFDTSFADQIVPTSPAFTKSIPAVDDDDEDFDPRADETKIRINNRRKSSVHIHLTDPSGLRESISRDELDYEYDNKLQRDLLGGSTTDLTQLSDSPLNPIDANEPDFSDPFDTTIVDKIVAPGKQELKFIEKELIGTTPPIYRSPSDEDFNPREDEHKDLGPRRASRPENLIVNKSVAFDVVNNNANTLVADPKGKSNKPLTPYYTREVSITEDFDEEEEAIDKFCESLPRSQSNQDLANIEKYQAKRRHSDYPTSSKIIIPTKPVDLLGSEQSEIRTKVLTPSELEPKETPADIDPFDTSFAGSVQPSKTELKLLAKEFSCEDTIEDFSSIDKSLLGPAEDNIFQIKALTPEPTRTLSFPEEEDIDPFDTSFASNLQPGRTELKLLESELLN